MPTRVASIISRMNVGGPAVLLAPLFDDLQGPDFEHLLITGRCLSNEIDYLDSHSVKTPVLYIDEVSRSIGPIADLLGFIKLCRILRKFKPDVVHTHTSKAGLIGRLAALIACPSATRIHTFHGHVLTGYFSKPISQIFRVLEILLGFITDVPVAVTFPVRDELIRFGICRKKSWQVIHPGVELKSNISKVAKIGKCRLGWIGRFEPIKNPLLAINAFSILHKSDPGIYSLTMAGEGVLFEQAKAVAHERNLPIDFIGWLKNTDNFYSNIDLLLLTSLNEGLGMVMLEAAQYKVPTVASNVGGISDFVEEGKTGRFSDLTPEAFAKIIREVTNNSNELGLLGENAFKLVEEQFNSSNFVELHKKLYKK